MAVPVGIDSPDGYPQKVAGATAAMPTISRPAIVGQTTRTSLLGGHAETIGWQK